MVLSTVSFLRLAARSHVRTTDGTPPRLELPAMTFSVPVDHVLEVTTDPTPHRPTWDLAVWHLTDEGVVGQVMSPISAKEQDARDKAAHLRTMLDLDAPTTAKAASNAW